MLLQTFWIRISIAFRQQFKGKSLILILYGFVTRIAYLLQKVLCMCMPWSWRKTFKLLEISANKRKVILPWWPWQASPSPWRHANFTCRHARELLFHQDRHYFMPFGCLQVISKSQKVPDFSIFLHPLATGNPWKKSAIFRMQSSCSSSTFLMCPQHIKDQEFKNCLVSFRGLRRSLKDLWGNPRMRSWETSRNCFFHGDGLMDAPRRAVLSWDFQIGDVTWTHPLLSHEEMPSQHWYLALGHLFLPPLDIGCRYFQRSNAYKSVLIQFLSL